MQIDLGLVFAAIGGAGAVLGTIAAAEKYISSKFENAVVSILQKLEYDRKVRHIQRELEQRSSVLSKLQDADVSLQVRMDGQYKDLDNKMNRLFAVMNAQKIKQAKLESAARVLGAKLQGDASISAILMDETQG